MIRFAALVTMACLAAPALGQPMEARAGGAAGTDFMLRPAPPREEPRGHPLRYAPVETDRQHLSVGIAPPGARRALLGLHYRLRLGDQRRPAARRGL